VLTIGRNYSKFIINSGCVLERIRIVHHCRSLPQLAFSTLHFAFIFTASSIPPHSHFLHFSDTSTTGQAWLSLAILHTSSSLVSNAREPTSSSTIDRQFNYVRAHPESQILLVPPCRRTRSDVFPSHPSLHGLSCKSTLASLGIKLVDIIILFQVASSLSSSSNSISPPSRRPLVPPDWTLIFQYLCTCSIYDTAEQRQIASNLHHPPFSSQLYTTHQLVCSWCRACCAPYSNNSGHPAAILSNPTSPKHRDTSSNLGAQFLRLSFTFLLHPNRFSRFLGPQLSGCSHIAFISYHGTFFDCAIFLLRYPTPHFLYAASHAICLTKRLYH
jgi:hypothetical protein